MPSDAPGTRPLDPSYRSLSETSANSSFARRRLGATVVLMLALASVALPLREPARSEDAEDSPLSLFLSAEALGLDGNMEEAAKVYCEALEAVAELPPAETSTYVAEAALAIHRVAGMGEGGIRVDGLHDTLREWAEFRDGVDPLLSALARFEAGRSLLRLSGDLSRARKLWAPLGFLESWRVVGPFDNERGGGFLTSHGPEATLDEAESYPGKKREVFWRRLAAPPVGGLVDLDSLLRPNDEALAYLLTYVVADTGCEAALRFGTNEGYRVWVNGDLVGSEDVNRPAAFDQTVVGIRLEAGWNAILFKVTEAEGAWSLRARLTRPDGRPLTGVSEADPGREAHEELRALVERRQTATSGEREAPPVACHEGVETSLRKRIAEHPDDARAHYLLGTLLRRRKAHDTLEHPDRDLVSRAVTLDAAPAAYHYELARTYERSTSIAAQRDDNAWRTSMAAAEERGCAIASYLLAQYYFSTFGNTTLASRHIDAALGRSPRFAAARLLRGVLREQAGFPLARRRAARDALELAPSTPEAALAAAELLRRDGKPGEAEAVLRRAFEVNRLHAGLCWSLVQVLLDVDRVRDAERILEERALLDPFDTDTFRRAALVRLGRNDVPGALDYLDRALEICPEDHELLEQRGQLLLRLGRKSEAAATWETALSFQPNIPDLRERVDYLLAGRPEFEEEFRRDAGEVIAEARAVPYEADDGEAARVLLDLAAVEVHEDGTTREFSQRVVEILNDRGVRDYDRFSTYYVPSDQVLEYKDARVFRPDGSSEASKLTRFESRPTATRGFRQAAGVDLPPLHPGDVIDVQYVREDIVQSFFGDYFGTRRVFQGSLSTREKVFVLRVPAERRFYFHSRNLSQQPDVAEDAERKQVTYTWRLRNIDKIDPEPAMPASTEVLPTLEVSTFESWQQFSEWYWNLIRKQYETSPDLSRTVKELTSGKDSDMDRVRAIYDFVVSDIRYNAWEFGVHGFKPYNAATVFARRFGDCKDKSTLLTVMLEEVGITSYPVLIRAESRRSNEDLTLPMVHHFNHCITYVPPARGREGLYLDGTARHHSLEELPSMDRGAMVLVVRPDGGDVRQIAWNEPSDLSLDEEWTVELDEDLGAAVRIRLRARGDFAVRIRDRYEVVGKRRARLEERVGTLFAGARVIDETFSDLDDLSEPVLVGLTVEVPKFADRTPSGVTIAIPDDFFGTGRSLGVLGALEERQYDLLLANPRRSSLRVVLEPPPGFAVKSLPAKVARAERFGKLAFEVREEDSRIVMERVLETTATRVPLSAYERFREFSAALDRIRSERVVLEPR